MRLDPAQTDIIEALLAQIPFDGWTDKSVRQALIATGGHPEDSRLLFPGGTAEMISVFCAVADSRMAQAAAAAGLEAFRVPGRVRAIIAIRLEQNRAYKEAIRRALAWLSIPTNAPLAAKLMAATIDEIWHTAGDASADFAWYSKRGILAGVYSATLLFWLRDVSEEDEATLAFLERRLTDVGKIGGTRKRLTARMGRLRKQLKSFIPVRA